jgi:hypothetical protein
MSKLGKGLLLSGILTFCLAKFAEQFSKDNGNIIDVSYLLWISGGIALFGLIIIIYDVIQNRK